MTALIRAEARKTLTTRSSLVMAAVAVAYPALALLPAVTAPEPPAVDRGTLVDLLRGGTDVLLVATLLIGILAAAGEYRHGTIVPQLLVTPRRGRFLAAKLAWQAALGAALALVISAVGLLSGAAYLATRDVPADVLSGDVFVTVAAAVFLASVHATIGAAVGAVVRNQTAAVAGALVWLLVVENAVPLVLHAPGLRRWLPGGATDRLLHLADSPAVTGGAWLALLMLVTLTTVLAAAAAAATRAADVH